MSAQTGERRGDKAKVTALVLAKQAEKMMAREGVRHTPLRQIARAAGQKNESVMQYHFGSRERLIEAVLELRVDNIDATRREMIKALRTAAGPRPLTSSEIVRAMLEPVTTLLREVEGDSHYVRFIGQISMDDQLWVQFKHRAHGTTMALCRDAYADLATHLPRDVMRQRFKLAIQTQCYGLCAVEHLLERNGAAWPQAETQITVLHDVVRAILDAPLSADTVAALRAEGKA